MKTQNLATLTLEKKGESIIVADVYKAPNIEELGYMYNIVDLKINDNLLSIEIIPGHQFVIKLDDKTIHKYKQAPISDEIRVLIGNSSVVLKLFYEEEVVKDELLGPYLLITNSSKLILTVYITTNYVEHTISIVYDIANDKADIKLSSKEGEINYSELEEKLKANIHNTLDNWQEDLIYKVIKECQKLEIQLMDMIEKEIKKQKEENNNGFKNQRN